MPVAVLFGCLGSSQSLVCRDLLVRGGSQEGSLLRALPGGCRGSSLAWLRGSGRAGECWGGLLEPRALLRGRGVDCVTENLAVTGLASERGEVKRR